MPPKGSGRGAARGRPRGRGRGRGGATASAPEEAPIAEAPEPIQAPLSHVSEKVAISTPAEPEAISTPTATQDAAPQSDVPTTAEAAAAAPTSDSPAATPTDSVKSSGPPNKRGTGSATRGARGRLKVPPNTVRRSKEERDAAEQAEAARKRERLAELQAKADAAEAAARRREFRGRGRGGGSSRGRGGFMSAETFSGPFSGGVVSADTSRHAQRGHERGWDREGYSRTDGQRFFGQRQHQIKKEPRVKDENLEGQLGIKSEYEDGGYISSDPEEAIEGPRMDVDYINLVSSDEDEEDEEEAHLLEKPGSRRVGINTDATTATSGEINARTTEGAPDTSVEAAARSAVRKGKARAKDVEIVSETRTWKGVYQDEDASTAPDGVRIKDEPIDEPAAITVPEDVAVGGGDATQNEPLKELPSSPEQGKKKILKRRKSSFKDHKPILQTDEERAEWKRHETDLQILAEELGNIGIHPTLTAPVAAAQKEQDAQGDTAMANTDQPAAEGEAEAAIVPDKRADRVYLFQLPPIVPDLQPAPNSVKKEPQSPTLTRDNAMDVDAPANASSAMADAQPPTTAGASTESKPIKIEDSPLDFSNPMGPSLKPGLAGKLRVHRSGRATLDWGGTSLELSMGTDVKFLQDVVVTRLDDEKERVGREGGESWGLGQVRGKFVVTPDWAEIVG
ncbi:hypothetical protein H2199_007309 [Coniosporium tulheliwenetii]|uniref:Uncharacterized protein n=1 Tax=Coniosporium tulheliwenetii TaxID=3383036 RepID=A0ACC2YQX3_9PEZI|nr:hypothetical protein H2199_007309 [Cladosporium sp. JES 115]